LTPPILVLGQGIAAWSTVSTLRHLGYRGPISIVIDPDDPPVLRPALGRPKNGLPFSGALPPPHRPWGRLGVTVIPGPAARIEVPSRLVYLTHGQEVPYRAVVVATGARPIRPFDVPDSALAWELYTRASALFIHASLADRAPGRVAVLGGGPNGLEWAHRLVSRGEQVVLIRPRWWSPLLHAEVGWALDELLAQHGVRIIGDSCDGLVLARGRLIGASTRRCGEVAADAIALALGLAPAVPDGLGSVGPTTRGLVVDRYLRCSPGVWAAGDVVAGRSTGWRNAWAEGMAVGRNISGNPSAVADLAKVVRCRLFGRHLEVVGVGASETLRFRDRLWCAEVHHDSSRVVGYSWLDLHPMATAAGPLTALRAAVEGRMSAAELQAALGRAFQIAEPSGVLPTTNENDMARLTQVRAPFRRTLMLVVEEPGQGPRRVRLEGPTVVGRDAKLCHVVLQHVSVSRVHARLVPTVQGVTVEDLGSTNGTQHAEHRVLGAPSSVPVGDAILVGDVVLRPVWAHPSPV
jgi:NADPH-dependent 2,4-dienoyl-CoA reductase/sulfur reductase-like enzyme